MRPIVVSLSLLALLACTTKPPASDITSDASAYVMKADQLAQQGAFAEALSMANLADSLQPDNRDILHLRAGLKRELGNYADAITDYTRAVELCTDQKQRNIVLSGRAKVHLLAGQLDLACADWKAMGDLGTFDYEQHCK